MDLNTDRSFTVLMLESGAIIQSFLQVLPINFYHIFGLFHGFCAIVFTPQDYMEGSFAPH